MKQGHKLETEDKFVKEENLYKPEIEEVVCVFINETLNIN